MAKREIANELWMGFAYLVTGIAIMGVGLAVPPAMHYMANTPPNTPTVSTFANVVSTLVLIVSFGWCLYFAVKGGVRLENIIIRALANRFRHSRKGVRALIELLGLCLTVGGFIFIAVKMFPVTINRDAPPPDTTTIIAMIIAMIAFLSGFALVESIEPRKKQQEVKQ